MIYLLKRGPVGLPHSDGDKQNSCDADDAMRPLQGWPQPGRADPTRRVRHCSQSSTTLSWTNLTQTCTSVESEGENRPRSGWHAGGEGCAHPRAAREGGRGCLSPSDSSGAHFWGSSLIPHVRYSNSLVEERRPNWIKAGPRSRATISHYA